MHLARSAYAYAFTALSIALCATAAAGDAAPRWAPERASLAISETMYIIATRIRPEPATGPRRSGCVRGELPRGERPISLDVSQETMEQTLRTVGAHLGLGVVLSANSAAAARRAVSVHATDASGAGVLDVLLEDNGLTATVKGDVLFVAPRAGPGAGPQIPR
jgi:hypothetical protein